MTTSGTGSPDDEHLLLQRKRDWSFLSDSCVASQSASDCLTSVPRTISSVVSPANGGKAQRPSRRTREYVMNQRAGTFESRDDDKIRGRGYSGTFHLELSNRYGFPRPNVRPSTLVFHFRRIRLALDDFLDCESRRLQVAPNLGWLKIEEVHGNRAIPQLVVVRGLISDVKCKQKQTASFQHPKHLPKYGG